MEPAGPSESSPVRQDAVELGVFLNALHCGALLLLRDGRIACANQRLEAMTGRAAGALQGQALLELCEPDGTGRLAKLLAGYEQAGEAEGALRGSDGRRLPVVIVASSAAADQRVLVVFDISRQKEAEERYHRLYQELSSLSDTVLEQALGLKRQAASLEEKVRDRTAELFDANIEAIYMLAVASEARDEDTGAHIRRIEGYARAIATEMAWSSAEVDRIGYSAVLHDVGKLVVPDSVLKKPGPLTADERLMMESHTIAGERILSDKPFFELARRVARSHHENWDGSGYPDRIAADDIPEAARIVRLVDVFDALTSSRVYKSQWSVSDAVDEIMKHAGKLFDPRVIEAFRSAFGNGKLNAILATHGAPAEQVRSAAPNTRERRGAINFDALLL